ncbi:5eca67b6-6c5f-4074-a7a2-0575a7874f93 [Thermothielavioides terrestris]|uniref:5eca67b6-6c5f-4074-a7a2-0575a7874f93 n=1 Tax=Thermothielavioides terrestris TaxID=2587410 RepID=A0A3S4ATE1_9PEZI|nr:5eca67b6-6c5f-4074-a7a2-0575a7874f93 [Thermothielavioides terrestris]
MPCTPRILLTIDTPLLSTPSADTLVLSRKVNDAFTCALAVASLRPRNGDDDPDHGGGGSAAAAGPLFAHNVFAWDDDDNDAGGGGAFRVAVSYSPAAAGGGGGGGAISASFTDAVEVAHGETVRFSGNRLVKNDRFHWGEG